MAGVNDPQNFERRRTRSQGVLSPLYLLQQANLAALTSQCNRGRTLAERSGVQAATSYQVQRKLQALGDAWAQCDKGHRDLLEFADEADVATYLADASFTAARDLYYDTTDLLDGLQVAASTSAAAPASAALPADQLAGRPSNFSTLERIPIPTFAGDVQDWPNFFDMFSSLIVNETSLNNVYKFYYLKKSLKGNALSLIKNIAVTHDNFEPAWKIITDYYQDVPVLTFALLVRLLKLEPVLSNRPGQLENLVIQTREILTSLESLGEPIGEWSSLLIVLTLLRLDSDIRKDWERTIGKRKEFPKYVEFEKFLQSRIHAESTASIKSGVTTHSSTASPLKRDIKQANVKSNYTTHVSTSSPVSCIFCSASHTVKMCDVFRNLNSDERLAKVRSMRLCYNCFRSGHYPTTCRHKARCAQCNRRHHTLLHESLGVHKKPDSDSPSERNEPQVSSPATSVSVHNAAHLRDEKQSTGTLPTTVLLATAMIVVSTPEGRVVTLRALIDQGSERSFISESAAQILRVHRNSINASVVGVGGRSSGQIKFSTKVSLLCSEPERQPINVDCLIMSKLTSYVPRILSRTLNWKYVLHLPLADPDLSSSKSIDLILGADVYGEIILDGVLKFPQEPIAQQTVFGWILSGPCVTSTKQSSDVAINSLHVVSNYELNESISKFWEIEEIPFERHLTKDEQRCEDLFTSTTRRDSNGKYHVNLPFKTDFPIDIGESYHIAYKQYIRLERKLDRDPALNEAYHAFLREYLELGHMIPYTPRSTNEQTCYIPHHPVIKESSLTTKVRVVFNASSHTSNGKTLNDNLLIGPKLQQDLASIILRWRRHRYVLISDVEKMFRQIGVMPEHSRFQLIWWRPTKDSPIAPFRLQTVTYGTAPAPYLSLRVLQQLSDDERSRFPLAATQLVRNTYVDDVVFGAASCNEARTIRDELIQMTASGGLSLRKWSSNEPSLLVDLPAPLRASSSSREFPADEKLKVLGISWQPHDDCFHYAFSADPPTGFTKRLLLSFIAKLFDPLGWLSPVIIVGKIFMQKLWLTQLAWDAPLPPDLVSQWSSFTQGLSGLSQIHIPRWIQVRESCKMQLHAFCDASQFAYAANIYLRIENDSGIHSYLLASKTKVAPLKTLTIPRLELCAAELLSRLIVWTTTNLDIPSLDVFAWSDSAVTLAWIVGDPSQQKVFVANRVSRIQSRNPQVGWHYVPTDQNPADLATRGISVVELTENSLWWHGPDWLQSSVDNWPSVQPTIDPELDREERAVTSHVATTSFSDLSQRCSDWEKLISAAATFMRYRDILLSRVRGHSVQELILPDSSCMVSYRKRARIWWLKIAQSECFAVELSIIRIGGSLPRGNRLISLDPYLDEDDLLRVRGRLEHSSLSTDVKHPIILGTHHITSLVVQNAHLRTFHGGLSLTVRFLFETYWILRAKIMVKSTINRCINCVRQRASLATQRMADLPPFRIQRQRPFQHVGVDYAGPFNVKVTSGRGHHAHKSYIALFVCLTTRAVHIELVHDYTTATFLAAFKRFCARRGLPSLVFSDNGTNFQGAARELSRDLQTVLRDPQLAAALALDQIEWKFIPPGSPHFGGIWESGVKSVKYHLRRIVGDHKFTAEEFSTVLCRIEACLNSRPIASFSSNPDDLSYLTPGHFLIGSPLIAPPEPSTLDLKETRLIRWKFVQNCTERFWKLWSQDYLRTLQKRSKWRQIQTSFKIGDIVLVRNDNLPPTKWELGRVIQVYPGDDGLVRVCQIKTALTVLTRPIHKLCLLPVTSQESAGEDAHLPTGE